MVDVFLSYARSDQARIEPLVHALKRAGLTVFWDRMLEGGDYETQLKQQISQASAVVIAASLSSAASQYVVFEAHLGAEKLVAARIDDVPVGNLPRAAQKLDIIDLSKWVGDWDDPGLAKLIARVWAARAGTLGTSVSGRLAPDAQNAGTVNVFNREAMVTGTVNGNVSMNINRS